MSKEKKCDKCTTVKSGMLTPAIMYSTKDIDHDDCHSNCANDRKPNIFVSRIAIALVVLYIGLLVWHFYKG